MELKRFICSFSWILLFFKNFRKYNAMNSNISRRYLDKREQCDGYSESCQKVFKFTILKSNRADV